MITQETYVLNNGVVVPKMALGTWMIEDGDAAEAVRQAAKIGYRHFDTAQAYANESGVGEGIRTCGVQREELFVTTKLDAAIKTFTQARKAINTSLETLGLDWIDMMIIHSPQPWDEFRAEGDFDEGNLAAWSALEEACENGTIRAIGLSNFEIGDIENILKHGSMRPAVNQVLAHVGNMPEELIGYCQDKDILVEAYSPMGHGSLLDNAQLGDMASRYGVSTAQLAIRYILQRGLLPLPKTANPEHMRSNAAVDFTIADDDMATLDAFAPARDYGEANVFPVFAIHAD